MRDIEIRPDRHIAGRIAHATLALVSLLALLLAATFPVGAVPVAAPFGQFPKAIVFTGPNRPPEAYPIIIADGNGSVQDTRPGFILTPLGDGSWAVSASVYPGAQYQYYFEYRVPEFESDTTGSFLFNEPGGNRTADANRTRTIVIPAGATNDYVVYNAYGDRTVFGVQGNDPTLSAANPFLANWRGATLISSGTDADTTGRDETKNYNVTVTQVSGSSARLSWEYTLGGDGFAPQTEGANRFGAAPFLYGFQVMRADSRAATPLNLLSFQNITASVTGQTVYPDNDNDPWNSAITFTDTGFTPSVDSTYVYTVRALNAYGMVYSETEQLTWSGGYDVLTWAKLAVSVDGAVEPMYGTPIATDPRGDQAAFPNLDLVKMWATKDVAYHYFALQVGANIANTAWGRYGILIDTTGDSQGATDLRSSSLGSNAKKVAFLNNRPEYAIVVSSTNGSTPANYGELLKWNGATWDNLGQVEALSSSSSGETSHIEVAIARDRIGSPRRIWIEGYATGNDADNPVLDTVNRKDSETGNNEWTAPGFSGNTTGRLALSTPFPPALMPPVALTATVFDTRVHLTWMPPAMNEAVFESWLVCIDSIAWNAHAAAPGARVASLPVTATRLESAGLVPGRRYHARVFSVGADGETAGSRSVWFDVPVGSAADTIVVTQVDSSGVTSIEIAKSAMAYADSFFTVEILNFNEIYERGHFTDSEMMEKLVLIEAANEKLFFSPHYSITSSDQYPDTYSSVRRVIVRRPSGAVAPSDYFLRVTFRIPYRTSDGQTLTGAQLLKEGQLVLRKLDENRREWVEAPTQQTQWIDYDSDRVTIVMREFSIWNLVAAQGTVTNLDRMVVYPNPFNARDYIAAGHPLPARVTFAFIPTSTERIEIFNVAGERVRTLDRNDASEFETDGTVLIAKWDAKNDSGRDVASGVYMFWVRANGQVRIGKIAIVK